MEVVTVTATMTGVTTMVTPTVMVVNSTIVGVSFA